MVASRILLSAYCCYSLKCAIVSSVFCEIPFLGMKYENHRLLTKQVEVRRKMILARHHYLPLENIWKRNSTHFSRKSFQEISSHQKIVPGVPYLPNDVVTVTADGTEKHELHTRYIVDR